MKKSKLNFALSLLITIILTLGLSISFQNILAAWQEPTTAAPGSNLLPPVFNEHTNPSSSVLIGKPVGIVGGFSVAGGNLVVDTGSIGIGVTSPAAGMEIRVGDDRNALRITNSSNNNRYSYFGHNVNGPYWQLSTNNDVFRLKGEDGTAWMTLMNGNVGIGTTNPQARLDINGGNGVVLRIANGGDIRIDPQVSGNSVTLYNDTGSLWATGDICTTAGSKCLSTVGGAEIDYSACQTGISIWGGSCPTNYVMTGFNFYDDSDDHGPSTFTCCRLR